MPLPQCNQFDVPYWRINLWLCRNFDGWREWQTHKPMSAIIPEIDDLISSGVLTAHPHNRYMIAHRNL